MAIQINNRAFYTRVDTRFYRSLIVAVVVAASINCAVAQSSFENSVQFVLPLLINKSLSGEINSTIALPALEDKGDLESETPVSLPSKRLRELLSQHANEEQLGKWLPSDTGEGQIELTTLRARGLQINYDSSLLEITAVVPRLGLQQVSIRNRGRPVLSNHYQQANVASGLSYRIRDRYNHRDTRGNRSGLVGVQADISGFTSVGGFNGWSLYYDANYDQTEDVKLAREDVTLVKDFYERGLRLSIGDVRPTVSRFQASPDLLGVSLERNYRDINPFRNLRPSGRSTFTLERDSDVSFAVNGDIVMTEELPQGTYSIRDFPLVTGANDVRIYVDDGTGRVEVSNFSTYVDTSLLAAGITNYGVTVGAQRAINSGRQRDYEDELALLAFYEKGITPNLTLGAQAEFSQGHSLVSSSAIFGARKGVLAFEAALSDNDAHGSGQAATAQYSYRGQADSKWSFSHNAQAAYRSQGFISLGERDSGGEEWSLRAGSSLSKSGRSYSFAGEVSQTNGLQTNTLRLSHTRQMYGLSLSLGYQYIDSDRDGSDNRFNISVLKTFDGSRLRSQYKSDKQELRTDWSADAIRSVGQSRSVLSMVNSPETNSIDLNSRYIGSLFEANYQHRARMPKGSNLENSYVSTLTLSGGVGLADGAFAVGRPFKDGFMVVDRHKNLKGKKVAVLRGSDNGDSVSTFSRRSKALVPLSNRYRTERYVFSVDDLPNGYDLGAGVAKLYPGTTAGFRFKLGSDAANTVMGKVFWPDGEALNLVSGKVVSSDGQEEGVVFTNRTGRFVAEKLTFGKYKLVFGRDDDFVGRFIVAQGDEPGLVLVDDIVLQKVSINSTVPDQ